MTGYASIDTSCEKSRRGPFIVGKIHNRIENNKYLIVK